MSYAKLASENVSVTHLQEPEEAPQGRHLGLYSTIILFVSRILGSGFLAISSGMYNDCGRSPFIFLLSWVTAAILAFSGLFVYLELGSLIPRSGGTKVFLEFIYDKPYMMMSVIISVYSVMFGFTLLNLLVFGEYFLHAFNIEPTVFRTRLTGLSLLYIVCAFHGLSVRHGIKVQDFIGFMKLILAAIIVCTGIWVNMFPYSVTHIEYQMKFDEFFPAKTKLSFSLFASSVIKGTFAFSGWNSVHTVTNEIKDPIRTLKIAGPVALSIISLTYLVINFTYLAVIPSDEIARSGQLIGSILFEKVFGYHFGKQFLTLSSAICTGGNVFVVLYTISRVSQEVFREGYLPFSGFMASNWPRDAPLPTLLLSCAFSTLIIVLSPGGDVYNYIVSLESYPQQLFVALCAIGIFIIRYKHPDVIAPIRSSYVGTSIVILISSYLLILPLTDASPNPLGMEKWIPYTYLALLSLFVCFVYWLFMFLIGPRLGGYTLLVEETRQEDGLVVKKWVRDYARHL
ncbi:amino acid transporter [Metschnikowia bicuspidata var. bicuspidata NRRL YB-4993]|uniref:Amino acid transporter n=1 Tax=Metschnikowia bicuspidata var. bicuspidata NRRL YB-4993 TaxID=869754 RepID=A0A1A0H5L9_9ASCO|nr:amino acid transporter [Metschnikowia bicuspidata var. bicuspidata NRRL YB-4993]OBA19389.1 amino acid transporter [Metschnikowia bicuspidata var. bicuspidata NRRL YB-4993]